MTLQLPADSGMMVGDAYPQKAKPTAAAVQASVDRRPSKKRKLANDSETSYGDERAQSSAMLHEISDLDSNDSSHTIKALPIPISV